MNKRIYNIVKGEINDYKSNISVEIESNSALFNIFDNFLHTINGDKKVAKDAGVEFISAISNNLMHDGFNISENSSSNEGIGFMIKFDGVLYTIRFKKFRDGTQMFYLINIRNSEDVFYSGSFIYKYLMFCALESSKLKGSYFSMPKNRFDWSIKSVEVRGFDDIYLPNDIMGDLHLYVDIYKEAGRILRYLKVGNPGVGKTEAALVLASELNKMGVTIIKTPICETLHEKVELANVLAPSLIILDDIDLSLGDRNKGAYSSLMGDFLDVMDGTDKLANNVGVIATTNAAHLLDLAAQRPGRFDKTLLFDDITHDNIRDIIKKSLKVNFKVTKGKVLEMYTDKEIINKFYNSGVSGSHIFNAIKMLKLRYDTIKEKNVTVAKIVSSIESELKVIEKVRKVSYLKEKYDRGQGNVGFKAGFSRNKIGLSEDEDVVTESPRRNSDYS
jgi:hypothetical protein